MAAQVRIKTVGSLDGIAKSDQLGDQLEAIAAAAFEVMKEDPNRYYVSSLRMRRFLRTGRRGRITIRMGAVDPVGGRIEAKRGTMARALARAGLA